MVEWIGSQACDLYLAAGIHGLGACYSQSGTYVLGLILDRRYASGTHYASHVTIFLRVLGEVGWRSIGFPIAV